MILSCIG